MRRTSVLPQANEHSKNPGIQKETPAIRLVFLFGGDTQTRTGGGAFAELCLTTWLCRHMDNRSNCLLLLSFAGAGDEARTRYLHLGKVALYQMSYTCKSMDLQTGIGEKRKSLRRIPEVSSGEDWCLRPESNQRHGDFQSPALPTELQRQMATRKGLEPSTSGVTGRRSNQLNYRAI